ncbi:unnamed protein product, partial [Iphiclides podalirius]
DILVFTGL